LIVCDKNALQRHQPRYLDSHYIDAETSDDDLSLAAVIESLPTMSTAYMERQGKVVNAASLASVELYARTELVLDLLKGNRDPDAVERVVQHVASYTGLDLVDVRRMGGRIDMASFARIFYRHEGRIGGMHDLSFSRPDPFPWSANQRTGNPIVDSAVAPVTSAMVDLVTHLQLEEQ
jgi:carboxypeptidase C (cathepsin A)